MAARAQGLGIQPVPLPSPLVSLKLWLLVNDCVKAICKENAAGFIDCTPVACNDQGYMRPEFEQDGIHGNARYNDLIARHILSAIGTAEAAMPRT